MAISREVREGKQNQGVDESIAYTITTTPWGGTPSSVSVVVKDVSDPAAPSVVTATVMPTGSASVAGDVITLPALKLLTAEHLYKVEVMFTSGGNVLECYLMVEATE